MISARDAMALRLRHQRLVGRPFRDPAAVVQWMGAVQAQEFASGKWGLGLRGAGFTSADVDAAFNRGAILRTHVLRPTWHFVTPADIRWMLALTAPRVRAICRGYYRSVGIERSLERGTAVIERALASGPLTRTELLVALQRAGVRASAAQMGFYTLNAELEGLICSGPLRGRQFTYALMGERAPQLDPLSPDEALAELVRSYFSSHGPASIRDCSWWSGLTRREIARGIEMLSGAVSKLEIDGVTCWLTESAIARRSTPVAHLLPNYDEYVVAYQDRSLITRASGPRASFSGRDGFNHHVIIDGRLTGRWQRTSEDGDVKFAIQTFRRVTGEEADAIRAAVERYGRFVETAASCQLSAIS